MKKLTLITLIAFVGTLSACDAFLDVEPRTAVTAEQAFQGISGAEALLNATYDQLQADGRYGQRYMLYADALADNINFTVVHSGRYNGPVTNGTGSHFGGWGNMYLAINRANLLLANIDAVQDNVIGLEETKARIKGEAHFLRALNYFDLVRVYSYMPGREVNGWNAGVIIRTTPTLGASDANYRARENTAAVYALILEDLDQAFQLLDGTERNSNLHATRASVQALRARVHLHLGNWAQAETYAASALTLSGRSLVAAGQYVTSWTANQRRHPEAIFEMDMEQGQDGAATNSNEALASLTDGSAARSFNFHVIPTADLLAAHEAGDVRLGMYLESENANDQASGADFGQPVYYSQKWSHTVAPFVDRVPIFRVSEMYLTRAEALAEQGQAGAARDILNEFRAARGLANVDGGLSGDALIEAILHERRLEFAFEGQRFFDLKRRGMNLPKPQSDGANVILYTDFRILAPIPTAEVDLNPLLEQNPGY